MKKMKLSALVLAKNEQEMIEACLKQLNFVDEIIVLDHNSNDKTPQIAKKYADKVIKSSNDNFGYNRNLLAQEAKGEWILFLDCDERLDGENIQEINFFEDPEMKTAISTRQLNVKGKRNPTNNFIYKNSGLW